MLANSRKFWSPTKVAAVLAMLAAAGIVVAFGTWMYIDAQKLRVGYVQYDLNQLSFYFAQDQGLYRAAGLDMKFQQYSNDRALMDALANGQLDIAYVGLMDAILYNQNNNTPITILAAASVDGTGIVVRTNSSINSTMDLKNKTIAIPVTNGNQDFLLQVMLANANLSRSSVKIVTQDVASMPGNMNSSTKALYHVDAFIAWEPIASKSVHKAIYGIYGFFGRYLANCSNQPGDVIVASNAVLAQPGYINAIKHFLAVHVSVTKQINMMTTDAGINATVYNVLAKELGTNPADGKMALANTGFLYQPDFSKVRTVIAQMVNFTMITTIPGVDSFISSFYNTTLLNQTII